MGFNIQRLVSNVDANLICSICTNVMTDAVITLCGHSFCKSCLSTWLNKPDTENCPVCRTYTSKYETIPNISLRSIIRTLQVWCMYKDVGCSEVLQLDNVEKHETICRYRMTECSACKKSLRECHLADHCVTCPVLKFKFEASDRHFESALQELNKKILSLEIELSDTKKALEISKENAIELDSELRELRSQAASWNATNAPEFDSDYSYGYSPSSISQLSCLISKYLLSKPPVVDRNRIFMAIKRSFTYYHNYAGYAEDVHMLLATAYASNWFPEHHRWTLERWLEQVTNERFPRDTNDRVLTNEN